MTKALVPRRRVPRSVNGIRGYVPARQRALRALALAHPGEFRELYQAEVVMAGLWPVPGHTPQNRVTGPASKGLQSQGRAEAMPVIV